MVIKPLIDVHLPFPQAGSPQLRLGLAACRLRLHPGEEQPWVVGSYDELQGALPLYTRFDGPVLRITQPETLEENLRFEPRLAPMDLALGRGRPYRLAIDAGFLDGRLDLTGLPLTGLDGKLAKGRQEILFTAPNPEPMETFRLFAGAGRLEVRGLAHANLTAFRVEGGQADYLLDFSGELQRPARGEITLPQGSLEIHIPAAIPARISITALTGTSDVGVGFTKQAGAFWNQAALAGKTPLLTLRVAVLQGPVHLRSDSSVEFESYRCNTHF